MFRTATTLICSVALLNGANSALFAQDCNATAYIVHGIPGTDLGVDPAFPVDISVNGACAIEGFAFSSIAGPVALPEGMYDIAISPANAETPCGNEPALAASVELECGVNYSIVAYLDADGGPTAGLFVNDVSPTERGKSRVIVAHTAAAPMVDIAVQRPDSDEPGLDVENFANGDQATAEVRPGSWSVTLFPAGTDESVFGPAQVKFKPYTAYLVFAVGSLEFETFTLLAQPIGGLKPMNEMGTTNESSRGDRIGKGGR